MPLGDLLPSESSKSFSVVDVENMFFGAIISGKVDPDAIFKIKRDFCVTGNGKALYDLILRWIETKTYVDYLTALTELGKRITSGVAKEYLQTIISAVPDEYSSSSAAEQLETAFIRRNAVEVLDFTRTKVQEHPEFAAEYLRMAAEKMERISEVKIDFDLKAEFAKTVEELLTGDARKYIISTGIETINRAIGGYSTQEITVIGGRPGHAKTTSAVLLILSALRANPDLRAVLFELEMSKEMIKRKFIASIAGFSSFKMRVGDIDEDGKARIQHAKERLEKLDGRLFIYDNVYDLPSMHKIIRSTGARLSMVDFVGLMDESQVEDIRRGIARVALQAKRFAKAHNIAHIFYSQLNRGPEVRESHRPITADLAESDALGQLASEVILLYHHFKYTLDPKDLNKLYFLIDKARYSGPAEMKLYYDPDLIILRDM